MKIKNTKFKFLPRKNKNIKLNKNNSKEIIDSDFQLINQLSPYRNMFSYKLRDEKKEINIQEQFELIEQNISNNNKILNINTNKIIKLTKNIMNKNISNMNFINKDKLAKYKKIKNLKNNSLNRKKISKGYKIMDINKEILNNLSNSKSTKNNTAYTSLSLGKTDLSNNTNKSNIIKKNNIKIKTNYNNFKNLSQMNRFVNNDNKTISKIEYSSMTDKDSSNISNLNLNLNLSGKNNQKCLTIEDLKNIINKRRIIFPITTKKNVINYGKFIQTNNIEKDSNSKRIDNSKSIEKKNKMDILKCIKISNKLRKQKKKINYENNHKKNINNNNKVNNHIINKSNLISKNNIFNIYQNKFKINENNKKDDYNISNENNTIVVNNYNNLIIEKNEIEYIQNKIKKEDKREIKLNLKELKKLAYKNELLKMQNNIYNHNYENNEIIEEDEELTTENNDNNNEELLNEKENEYEDKKNNNENKLTNNNSEYYKYHENNKTEININNDINNEFDNEDLSSIIQLNLSTKELFDKNRISYIFKKQINKEEIKENLNENNNNIILSNDYLNNENEKEKEYRIQLNNLINGESIKIEETKKEENIEISKINEELELGLNENKIMYDNYDDDFQRNIIEENKENNIFEQNLNYIKEKEEDEQLNKIFENNKIGGKKENNILKNYFNFIKEKDEQPYKIFESNKKEENKNIYSDIENKKYNFNIELVNSILKNNHYIKYNK